MTTPGKRLVTPEQVCNVEERNNGHGGKENGNLTFEEIHGLNATDEIDDNGGSTLDRTSLFRLAGRNRT